MPDQVNREKIIDMVRKMRNMTVSNGCTPGEAAKFSAKVAEMLEKYQIEEAELRARDGQPLSTDDFEFVQNYLRTGKRVFNPGMTQVVNGLARGLCCECVLIHRQDEAVYGIIGEQSDADLVCQLATTVVPALRVMAQLEGAEHGYEGGALIGWCNQYLTGAGHEICHRLMSERKARSDAKRAAAPTGTALILVTGEEIAKLKKEGSEDALKQFHPKTRKTSSRMGYDRDAQERGREAGRRVGLNVGIEGSSGASGRIGG